MGMFDVSNKPDTLRLATSQAIIKVMPETMKLIINGKSPKGDIIETARVAATMAAKRTADLLPYCHPIPIDHIKVDVNLKDQHIEIIAEVKTSWKTGVEMESLTAVSIASLTIYDMLKPIDENLSIESIKLIRKSGGLKSFQDKYDRELNAAVVVISDSTSKGQRVDTSGKLAVERLKENGLRVVEYKILPDEFKIIESELKRLCDELKVDLLITSGGTGIGPRDITAEATMKVIDKEIKGISETLRAYGQRRTPLSMLSRGICGLRGNTVIVNLPGSSKGVSESLDALFPGISHVFKMIQGHGHQ
jgi:molybdenum cofactor biosynthesis protein MoaC